MKKIILAIFLLSISSNVFAKEETWSCHSVTTIYGDTTKEDFENSEYYKIDTVNVKIYFRKRKKNFVFHLMSKNILRYINSYKERYYH